MADAPACFVSYAKPDIARAEKVVQLLESEGIRCWLAPRDVPLGVNWGQAIIEAIDSCSVMILLLSKSSNDSVHVANEVERAVSKRKKLFPVRLEDVTPGPALELHVSSAQWVDVFTNSEHPTNRLVSSIKARLGIPEIPSIGPTKEKAKPKEPAMLKARGAPLGHVAKELTSKISELSFEDLKKEVQSAINLIVISESQAMLDVNHGYINDASCRAVFGELRERVPTDQFHSVRTILESYLISSDVLTRWKAIKGLIFFGARDVAMFREVWRREQSLVTRQLIVNALDNVDVQKRIEFLCEIFCSDQQLEIRVAAFDKLLRIPEAMKSEVFESAVAKGLMDKSPWIRRNAVAAAVSISTQFAVEIAKNRLSQDSASEVRAVAADVLSKHGATDSVALLARSLKDCAIDDYVAKKAISELQKRFGASVVGAEINNIGDVGARDLMRKASAQS